MRKLATVLVAVAAVMLGGCGAGDTTETSDDTSSNAGSGSGDQPAESDGQDSDGPDSDGQDGDGQGSGDESAEGTGDTDGSGGAGEAPDLIGLGLAAARDQAEEAGFDTQSHDATGRTRTQVLETNWRVCFQQPEPGADTDAVQLGVVKLEEDCPDSDKGADPPELGENNELPDFSGHSLAAATNALGADASVLPVDATDADRNIFVEKNWRICAQDPGPGTQWEGEQITFQVVKYDEDCPG